MKKNDFLDLKCTYLSTDAKGVCRTDGFCFYVDNLLKDEECNAQITGINGKTVYAKVMDITKKSVDRVDVKCKSFDRCGGCHLLHLKYDKQLEFKRDNVKKYFKDQGINVKVHDTTGMDEPFYYRNKVIASVSLDKNKIIYGMYEENSHEVIYNNNCLIQNKLLNEILISIKEILDKLKIKPEGFGGVLRHIMLRIGVKTNEVLVVFVTNSDLFPARKELVNALISKHKEIKTIIQNTNPRKTSVVLGDKDKVLYGPGFIYDILLGNKYKISAKSFYQINPVQTEKLYTKAIELANLNKNEVVMDAYCGIGTIGLSLAKNVKELIGVEIVKEAINDAINNARINNITNARFYCDDCKKFMINNHIHIDTLFVDPPRSGLDKEFINSIKRLKPKKIIYISCNPITQAENIRELIDLYSVSEIYPFDLFPLTLHTESVCLLKLK